MDMQRRKNKDKRKEIKDMETRVEKTIEKKDDCYRWKIRYVLNYTRLRKTG